MSIRSKAILLFTLIALGPVLVAVMWLVDENQRSARTSEQMLQSAVLAEVSAASRGLLRDVESDARAVAAVFGRGAAGQIGDDEALEAVRALIETRGAIDALRFQVPVAKVSSVIKRDPSVADVPEPPEALMHAADERGVGFGVMGEELALVVVPVPAPKGPDRPKGYVTAKVDLSALSPLLQGLAGRRFGGQTVHMLIATHERRAVASFGLPDVGPGADVASLPIWRSLPDGTPWDTTVSVVAEYESEGVPQVGVVETVPTLGWAVTIWRPAPVAYAALTQMRKQGLWVAAISAVLALLLGAFAGRGVTQPILALVKETRLIGARKWRELSPPAPRSDEIGELGNALGSMAKDLESSEEEIAKEAKLRNDLSRFMNNELVDAIVRGEHSLSLGGSRATVTVLFADVVGFTPLSESRDAAVVVSLLNELFSMLSEIVFRHGGTVDKFIGDCLMAVWGAPVAREDHAEKALAAAEDMMRFLETANEEWKEKYEVEVRLGIGVNSGEVIVGNIGSNKRMEYTVIGDVVNVAARLEAIARPNEVLVAGGTKDLVGDAFEFQFLGEKTLSGRKTETAVYALETD